MAKEKTPGIILYPEDIERIKRSVKPEYQFAVIYALAQFATTGELPTEETLGEGGMVAFEFIFDKVYEALQKYQETSEKRKAAVNSRWASNESKPIQNDTPDTNEYKSIQMNANVTKTKTETEIEKKSINVKPKDVAVVDTAPATDDRILAFDGSDLSQASADNEQAQRLVARYMPAGRTPVEFDPRVADISDLIAQYGLKKVEDTMKEAMRSDNRGGVSINFIKAILENKGSKSRASPGGDYLKRQYDDDYWKSIEQTFDDAI